MPRTRKTGVTVDYTIDTPYLIKTKLKEQEQRAEYTALRDIIQKRIKRIAKYKVKEGEADPREGEFYKRWSKGVPKLKDINKERIPYILSAMIRSLQEKASTIKGFQQETQSRIKGLQDIGLPVTNKNIGDFTNFMEVYRAQKLDKVIGSPEVADLWGEAEKKKVNTNKVWKTFQNYMTDKKKLQSVKRRLKNGKSLSDIILPAARKLK